MRVHGIIFDLGWTLVNFKRDFATAEAQRATDLGNFLRGNRFDVDGAQVYTTYIEELRALGQLAWTLNYEYPARLAMLRALRRYMSRADAAHFAGDALEVSFESVIPQWQLYPDALDTLTALRDAGCRLGAVSNTNDSAHVWRIVDNCGLRSWLSPIYISEEVGLRKPHPKLFRMVLEDWGLSPDQVIVVGDTLNADIAGAHSAGMRGVWIDRGRVNPWSKNEEHRDHIVPDATIQQLAELPTLLVGDL